MAKLTKAQAKAHAEACDLLQKDALTEDDKEFVLRNWNEAANHVNSAAGAFFTPYDMAFDFAIDVAGRKIIDLCAGIGTLSYAVWCRSVWHGERRAEITCVERNPDYLAVGRKVLPDATWIHADVLDVLGMDLGRFDCAISNPPFGSIKRSANAPRYTGQDFEYHVIDIASQLADYGTFIVPQMSAGFKYSGQRHYERDASDKAIAFQKLTGLRFEAGCGVDTAYYRGDWKGVSPLCEIICVDFKRETEESVGAEEMAPPSVAPTDVPASDNDQFDLFGGAAA